MESIYFGRDETPGKTYFVCDRYRASLTTEACASMWREGNHDGSELRARCKGCELGADHAGEADANLATLKGTLTCGRCHRPSLRLIKGHLCVSCQNREYEVVAGRNAKGTKPVHLAALGLRRLAYREGTEARNVTRKLSADLDELVVAALRDSSKRVQFAFHGAAVVPQLSLW